jgi:SAM-dependent methyltransferase
MRVTEFVDVNTLSHDEVQRRWEDAYVRFETSDEETRKFVSRLDSLGQAIWKKDWKVVEIFCGRGNGLKALESLGFTNLEGVDISPELVARYEGPAKLHVADCRRLPFEDDSRDLVIVQGGLHHLPIGDDLAHALDEVKRVLRKGGLFVMVEPWLTPFLHLVHFASEITLVRFVSKKFDAFATMTHYEADTYFPWLASSKKILELLDDYFEPTLEKRSFGKLHFVGKPRK